MAIVTVNGSTVGAVGVGGKQAIVSTRGSGQSGAVTLQIDTTKVTSRGQVRQIVADMLSTLIDVLPNP
jgi:hypothetical protein